MKLKNAAVGITVEVKRDVTDHLISGCRFEEGDLCVIEQLDPRQEYPELRLCDLHGNFRGWLSHEDVRRCK